MRAIDVHNSAKFGWFISINDKIMNNLPTGSGEFSAKFSMISSG